MRLLRFHVPSTLEKKVTYIYRRLCATKNGRHTNQLDLSELLEFDRVMDTVTLRGSQKESESSTE